ncbi:hypothetical protein [Leifsonia sp. LS-T14]|uniref:hypothetical protein n=1 Tax=unclassified Leifsonia TaxID=2663824 RepID=UPI0035A67031
MTAAAASVLLTATIFSQHPNRMFDRFRNKDKLGFWLPNWRFFAPEPAQNDFHVLHRTLSATGVESNWVETHQISSRRLSHLVWFPSRRTDKGIFDATADLMGTIPFGHDAVLASPAYRVLSSFVLRHIREASTDPVAGYQFMLASSTGYDGTVEPDEILRSPFIPLEQT